jgi:hypothetical protein
VHETQETFMKARILAVLLAVALPAAAQGNPSTSSNVSPTGSAALAAPKANARAAKAQNTQSPCESRRGTRTRANPSKKTPAT